MVLLILRDTFLIGDGVSGVSIVSNDILTSFMRPIFGRNRDRPHVCMDTHTVLACVTVPVTVLPVTTSIVRIGYTVI